MNLKCQLNLIVTDLNHGVFPDPPSSSASDSSRKTVSGKNYGFFFNKFKCRKVRLKVEQLDDLSTEE